MYKGNPIYEDHPQIAGWLKLLLGTILVITLIMGLILLSVDYFGALLMFGVTLFDLALFYCIMPSCYQVYPDRLKIVLGGPFGMTVLFKDIVSVSRVAGSTALGSSGVRLVTSSKYVVEIKRKGKMSVVISPGSGELFMEQLNQAMKNSAGNRLY
jgi:hypothetical protein